MSFKQSSKVVTLTMQQLDEFAEAVASSTARKVLAGIEAAGRLRPEVGATVSVGPLVVDLTGHEARLDGEPVALRPREFAVLAALAKHAGQVLSRDQLMEQAYPDPGAAEARAVDVAISHVRKAFGKHAGLIQTHVGSGYKLVAQPAPKARR